ncbi:hypothetical protein AGDE_05378 [Angomonas deanei]|uniref:Uncharacterized protein n=1 Tax=Angomonas deanei TaxID=59799 RepID=A0A7G2CNU7_9TRYP|nr:hypothetical protein AGDE_05378 [Angomonas deanei]CAD2220777.1 hypothetical protein, conserved [Angomonas deanei]|eukprot:EPY38551.1 hypothetical protein AGDE_05378 [Angomonas deanei]
MPIAADFKTLTSVHRVFPYLFSQAQFDAIAKEEEERASNPGKEVKPSRTQEGAAVGSGWNFREKNTTWTAALQFNCFHSLEKESLLITARHKVDQSKNGTLSLPAAEAAKFTAPFHFVPIGVLHGKNYYSNAFVFRLSPSPCKGTPLFLLYVSDVSFIDHAEFGRQVRESQLQLLSETERQSYQQTIEKEGYPPVEVLVLDMLSDRPYVSHVSVGESVAIATAIGARHTYFVGMSHSLEYTETNERLRNMNVADRMEMGYDGCVVYDAQRTSSNI